MTMPLNEEIRAFVVDNFLFGEGGEKLADGDSLVEGGVIDSMGVAELVAFVESRFGISVADDELVPDNLDSIARVAAFVERKRGQTAAAA